MIGSKTCMKQIKDLLKNIADKNKEKYGHMLDYAEVQTTRVVLGSVKDEGEFSKTTAFFDVIYGFVEYGDGENLNIELFDFFELDENFEQRVGDRLSQIEKAYNKATVEEREIIKRLEELEELC